MKKVLSLLLALIMTFGAYGTVFAQTVNEGVGYNVVVNGEDVIFAVGEAINVDGVSMLTADCFVSKFPGAGLTAESVAKTAGFSYNGKNYYSLRDVAAGNGLRVFWDAGTRTALVVNEDKYELMKTLIEKSNTTQADFKKVEISLNGQLMMTMTSGSESQNMTFPLSGDIKMDIEAPFMEMNMKMEFMGAKTDMHTYDDGENQYINSGEGWYKTISSLAAGKDMLAQIQAMNPATGALAEDLTFAGLKLTQSGDDYVLEGNMYTSETFNDEAFKTAFDAVGAMDAGVEFEWPKTIYVKYVMDAEGNIKSMSMKFGMTMNMDMGAELGSASVYIGADLNIPKFVIDGDFEAVVPQSVKDSAVDMNVPVQVEASADN